MLQIETDYQETIASLKVLPSHQKKIMELQRSAQTNRLSGEGIYFDNSNQAVLEKRYDDMKRFYETRVRDLERELVEYKEFATKVN